MARILSLGGSGFIGSYVVRRLLKDGHSVTVIDNFSKYGFLEHDFYTHPKFRLFNKDVRTMYPSLFKGYDYVLCLAALIGGIRYFHKIPYQIARDNTEIMTHAIDKTLASAPEAVFYYFSSSMVYERVQRSVNEEDARTQLVPLTNYGMQKLFGEFLTRGAHEEFGLKYVIVRPFNAVGSGELPAVRSDGQLEFGISHVIPDFVYKALVRQSPFELLGDGEQVRTFTHGKDIADAVVMMIEKGIRNEDFNICGTDTISMRDLAMRIWRRINGNVPFPGFRYLEAPTDDVRYRVGVSEKARRMLGWMPKYDIDYTIDDTAEFVRTHMRLPS
jgi:UDP-glucose 4-epimerase